MITHLEDPARPRWAVCGTTMGRPDPRPGPRAVCMSCMPAIHIRLPRRIAGPYCSTCGQRAGTHWDGCKNAEEGT